MNTTVPAGGEAMPAPQNIAGIFETPVNDAERMASILATLLEASLEKDMVSVSGRVGENSYHIIKDEVENILWSVYKLQDYIRAIDRAVERAS